MNPVHQLLEQVVDTGRLPDTEAIAAVVTRGHSVRDRETARRGILREARRIIGALDSGLPDQARAAAEDAAETYAEFTDDDTARDGRDLAADVPRARAHAFTMPANPNSAGARQLEEVLGSRVRDRVTAADLDRITTRTDATAKQVAEWRDEILAASRQISRTYASGQQGTARRLVKEAAVRFADMVADPDGRDPNEDIDDPRELAALVARSHNHS
ncbi:MAG: hypothetical protein JWR05_3684 [Mucilaginibacter sp.]|jgi:hypothetical protein|nr:hypothetical protein [Mucilaginibacter sp.]